MAKILPLAAAVISISCCYSLQISKGDGALGLSDYDSSKPMTPFNLPAPTAEPGIFGTFNLTLDEIINSPPTPGAGCSQNSAPRLTDRFSRQAVGSNSIWNQGYINFQIDPVFCKHLKFTKLNHLI
jgi:hypothetical protein